MPSGQEALDALVVHLATREVEAARFASDMEVAGMVAELSYPSESTYERMLYTARQLGKPVLALTGGVFPDTFDEDVAGLHIRPVRYSRFYVAKVAVDVFLEAHCGYRVPLGDGDRTRLPESHDRLF